MESQLKLPFCETECSRDIIFKKYNGKSNEVIRLDINIDLVSKKKGYYYIDENGDKSTEILYLDLSSKEFIVYNEDLRKCGYYDYNNEKIIRQKLPLNKKIIVPNFVSNISSVKKLVDSDTIVIRGIKYLKTKSGDIVDIINNSILGYFEINTNKAFMFQDVLKNEDDTEDDDDDDDFAAAAADEVKAAEFEERLRKSGREAIKNTIKNLENNTL